jgi:hypothetical protein
MKHSARRPISLSVLAALIAVFLAAPSGFAQAPPASPAPAAPPPVPTAQPPAAIQSLTAAQLDKINGWIANQGRDIPITPLITDILGLTKGDHTITCRAFAAEGDGNEIHQIYLLPDGKGYLDAHFYQDKLDVYWADKNFALIAALNGVRGEKPAAASFSDAQYGFGFEVTWWAKYADAH